MTRWSDASDTLADGLGMGRPEDAATVGDLLAAVGLAITAPDTVGLDLAAALQWGIPRSPQIREMTDLGLRWQRMRRERTNAASQSLQTLAGPSGALADILYLDRPADAAAADDLLAAAGLAV